MLQHVILVHFPCHAGLAERVLGVRLAKQQALRLSDWEARPLSAAQAAYAALDALACLRIHEVCEHTKEDVQNI